MIKQTTNQVTNLDMSELNKKGLPNKSKSIVSITWPDGTNIKTIIDTVSDNPHIYFTEGVWHPYKLLLESVPCHFGSQRWYFKCNTRLENGTRCGKRVRILYQTESGFMCRNCANLTYQSCNYSNKIKSGILRQMHYTLKGFKYRHEKLKRSYYGGKTTKQYKNFIKILRRSET